MNTRERKGFFKGFQYAGEGLLYAIRTQRNFRLHLLAAVAVMAAGYWLELSPASCAVLALTIGAMLVAEIVNTAIETLVDWVSPDYHPLAKCVKDLSAGAVLLMAITSVVVGLILLGPPLLLRLGWG